ncbi:hypothetical protein C3L50_14675 [Flavobacterium alvei]|uniref:Uracil-DNA glycosylase-like domain-containing protein n=1 Tax=Flavobacterium alvei TaxID=2080416 RepID=A0A2S5A414_9FLAO|nr:hypothetical protein [Flavobacterium alvei]POY37264.1 hypothetical protein C3L50_14675 [Flavobacterium alvei]
MPILHKFQNHDWKNGFWTENSILKTNHYKPEVLFIGTFNPLTPNANFADFFYGRNYFWPIFKNLFVENQTIHNRRRMPTNGNPIPPLNPTLDEIFKICKKCKIGFADMINSAFPHTEGYQIKKNDNVIFNELEYNLILDNKKKGIRGLAELNNIKQIEWNIENIKNYLCENPTIKYIYFTRKPSGIWLKKWNDLIKSDCSIGKTFGFIFTPSGQPLTNLPIPFNTRIKSLTHCWVWNNLQHQIPINKNGYCNLNHDWLIQNGVNPNNF